MIIRIFAAREPAKPLNDAQMCGSFLFLWIYGNRGMEITDEENLCFLFFSDYKDTTFYRETVIFTLLFWGGKL